MAISRKPIRNRAARKPIRLGGRSVGSVKIAEGGKPGDRVGQDRLGLALAREIAEAHGGRSALSSRDGGGLSVLLLLPS